MNYTGFLIRKKTANEYGLVTISQENGNILATTIGIVDVNDVEVLHDYSSLFKIIKDGDHTSLEMKRNNDLGIMVYTQSDSYIEAFGEKRDIIAFSADGFFLVYIGKNKGHSNFDPAVASVIHMEVLKGLTGHSDFWWERLDSSKDSIETARKKAKYRKDEIDELSKRKVEIIGNEYISLRTGEVISITDISFIDEPSTVVKCKVTYSNGKQLVEHFRSMYFKYYVTFDTETFQKLSTIDRSTFKTIDGLVSDIEALSKGGTA